MSVPPIVRITPDLERDLRAQRRADPVTLVLAPKMLIDRLPRSTMRRLVAIKVDEDAVDERELQFDVRRLEPGDQVDVFLDAERRWARGKFDVSTTGDALIELPYRRVIRFEQALTMGLRRVLH